MASERAVIYVDSSSPSLSSLNSVISSSSLSSCNHSISGKLGNPGRDYVIKIQIGEEGIFNRPVRIDVAGAHHRQRKLVHHISSDGDGDSLSLLDSSGQSSPRSDATPPPRLSTGKNGVRYGPATSRFGSETSESDTESDISAEYPHISAESRLDSIVNSQKLLTVLPASQMRNRLAISAAQFARQEMGIQNDLPEKGLYACASPIAELNAGRVLDSKDLDTDTSFMDSFSIGYARSSKSPPPFPPPLRPDGSEISIEGSLLTPRMTLMTETLLQSKSNLYKIPEFDTTVGSYAPSKVHIDQDSFHVQEFKEDAPQISSQDLLDSMQNFAGYKDFTSIVNTPGTRQIMSDNGTIRGVKNRVRDGIATFLLSTDSKNYNEKEQGRVVVYVTSMGVVRDTYQRCQKVKQILRNLLVKFDERDCYMNQAVQEEIRERFPLEMRRKEFQRQKAQNSDSSSRGVLKGASRSGSQGSFYDIVTLPQVFIEGQYLGDAETIEKLNETGELRKILQPYKNVSVLTTCDSCGGYRMLPCPVCNGSKKSVHRNHFTEEFVALKCMHCDQAGLVKCPNCNA